MVAFLLSTDYAEQLKKSTESLDFSNIIKFNTGSILEYIKSAFGTFVKTAPYSIDDEYKYIHDRNN